MSVHQLNIDGEICRVTCNKTGKTTWTAIGECNGKPIQEKGRSESDAIDKWKKIALFMNN